VGVCGPFVILLKKLSLPFKITVPRELLQVLKKDTRGSGSGII